MKTLVLAAIAIVSISGAAHAQSGALEGGWRIETVAGEPALADPPAVIEIGADGTIAGMTGCNRLTGVVTIGAEDFATGPLATTKMACPDPLMAQEDAVLKALETARRWTIDKGDDLLRLFDAAGETVLVLKPQP